MPDPRFFDVQGPFSLADLAGVAEAELGAEDDPDRELHDVAPLDTAGPKDVSFLDNPRYVRSFWESRAGACAVHPDRAGDAPVGMAVLKSMTPYLAYARIARAFYPEVDVGAGIDDSARIDETAQIGEDCAIGPGAVVGPGVEIGDRTRIGPNTVIARGVSIGQDCAIGPLCSIAYCLMGARVRLYAGVRIGEAGFGFAPSPAGFFTVPQLGRVVIEDDVEVGANTTIDRGAGPDTVIGAGCRIDNLVQIGHNVRLGKGCILVALAGISGSTTLEDNVVIGGQAGLVGHVTVGQGAQIGAQSGVMTNIPAGGRYVGSPAQPTRQWFRQTAVLKKLSEKKAGPDG